MANKALSLNRAQLMSVAAGCVKTVDIEGRGSGKSTKQGWKMHKVQQSMPRGTGIISGDTYGQILLRTLPSTLKFLESLGYHRDVHYTLGKDPLKYFGVEPFEKVSDYDHFLAFKNGFGFHLTSQDRPDSSRGFNVDYLIIDELTTQDQDKLEKQTFATNRGNMVKGRSRFGSKWHHGFSLSGSMPFEAKAMWVLDYAKYYEEDGVDIWLPWNNLVKLQLKFVDAKTNQERKELIPDIMRIKESLNFYPSKKGILFSLANVFDNIENVGWDYIVDMRRTMTDASFRIEMLNEQKSLSETAFYKIRDEVHLYDKYDYSYMEGLDYDFNKLMVQDSRMDGDIIRNAPIDVVIDFGAGINAMVCGQENNPMEYRAIKDFHTKGEQTLPELVDMFCDYYNYHYDKTILLWHDHTMISKDAVRGAYINEAKRLFEKRGWKVILKYIGKAPEHRDKYLMWEILLHEADPRFPKIRMNKNNFKNAILSMKLAPAQDTLKGIRKDKRSEQSKVIPRERATDFSDAFDIIIMGRYYNKLERKSRVVDVRTV